MCKVVQVFMKTIKTRNWQNSTCFCLSWVCLLETKIHCLNLHLLTSQSESEAMCAGFFGFLAESSRPVIPFFYFMMSCSSRTLLILNHQCAAFCPDTQSSDLSSWCLSWFGHQVSAEGKKCCCCGAKKTQTVCFMKQKSGDWTYRAACFSIMFSYLKLKSIL